MGGLHVDKLRDLTTAEIVKLVSVSGVVTRTSEVQLELLQGTFKCLDCGGVMSAVNITNVTVLDNPDAFLMV